MKKNHGSASADRANLGTIVGVVAALVFFLATGVITYLNIQAVRTETDRVTATHEVITGLGDLLSAMQDAETEQRGFLLTGNPSYLEPYRDAQVRSANSFQALDRLTRDDAVQQANLRALRPQVAAKFEGLARSIAIRQSRGLEGTLATIDADRDKAEMDAVRARIAQLRTEERRNRVARLDSRDAAFRTATLSAIMATLLGMALTIGIGFLTHRTTIARRRQLWLQSGEVGLGQAMLGDKNVRDLSGDIVDFLTSYTGAQASVLFKGEHGVFERKAMLGVPADANVTQRFALREGLLGRVAESGEPMIVDDVPEGYLTIGSALGRDKPRHLVIAPLHAEGVVNAVIELGFLREVDEKVMELLAQISGPAGTALRSAKYRTELQLLLEETQRQSEELQVQSEELKVSNEELEEQGRALKESAVRLEQQQVELEQTNSQLEEQAQLLERQRDDLAESTSAVEAKARELEQASQYKSDFLANMSHELRTPLNSLLILSKLLGDNPTGNLTDEQAQYARTIQASGNDLLNLINDILDLSKIEAGHVEVRPEDVAIARLVKDLQRTFDPIAAERRLSFEIDIDEAAPAAIVSDRQRLEQILKNLLANAFKFTEAGSVTLAIARAGRDRLALTVTDTGIGIAPEQQQAIFEAFRQADGSINRKFGGTGLGLSISRELARLLGGAIALKSEPGAGSSFTVTIPLDYDPALVPSRPQPAAPARASAHALADPVSAPAKPKRKAVRSAPLDDDRDELGAGRRVLLIVEDDRTFAKIVRDIAREASFQTLVAGTAEEALELAREHKPSGIVLDLGLPDQSGLAVLDRLKREDATRHIPVHVISASDQTQTAFSLGAMGYLVKPVKREELAQALGTLEAQLTRTMRRVLIVEDDETQRDAVARLLAGPEIETVGVGTAAECLKLLSEETFDCMVLDLSLPDASGFSLLETLSKEGGHSFPPVIVYTGHDLSQADEQRLRRYSNSIIIKGAKSPERLLDEVTLFLHQVVSELPPEQQRMIQQARNRDALLEGRTILVVEDDVRNVYSLTNILEPRGVRVAIARNGQEALDALGKASTGGDPIDLVLMDVMMPVMDGLEATRRIRDDQRWGKLPIIMLTAKAMPDDQEKCLAAGASDYMAKPLDVDKLLSLVRVWMPR
ncbi:response regulator [Sphingomonas sp. LHG3406-1]|uniref:response regulator n=1 Tax=Sphingomonas sp. LHG3406-1 TaxID=2804617 RepID=UPI00261A34C3|nr:response regulator [Sphingomonas sp. LHG3406-1]